MIPYRASRACRPLVRLLSSIPLSSSASAPAAQTKPRTTATLRGRSCQIRGYAATKARKTAPSYAETFTLSEIPLESFEAIISRNGDSFQRRTPAEYYECAKKFSDSVRSGSSPWAAPLKTIGYSAEEVHETACIMRQIQGPRSADAFATALWASASEEGYRPSTLSLARQLIRSGAYGRVPQLRRVETRFKQLVSTAKDADALTAEGELLFEQANYSAAVRVLERALQVGGSSFDWEPYCRLCMGKSYVKLGRLNEAEDVFSSLAKQGVVEADIELGNLLRTGKRDSAEQHIYNAACSGKVDMFNHLSEIALQRAAEAGDEKSKKEFQQWAVEWSKLADVRVEY